MRRFRYEALPGRVVFEAGGATDRSGEELARLRAERVLAVYADSDRELAAEIVAALGDLRVGSFTGVRPHVPASVAESARSAAADCRADCVLSIGGGSTTGTAKAIALDGGLPIVAVPTTYAGSEMTPVWGVTDGERKITGRSWAVLPRAVIYDPELTLSLPVSIAIPSAINALAHCVEAYYAPGANPITSLVADAGIAAIAGGLPRLIADPADLDARGEMLYGAYLSGAAFAVAGSGLHHTLCHVLGGAYGLPHAETHTVVLPHALAFNEPALPETSGRILTAMEVDSDGETSSATAIHELIARSGGPMSLREIGMRAEDVDEATDLVVEAAPIDNPRRVDHAGITELLGHAFEGTSPIAARSKR